MVNGVHLAILKQGAGVWRRWRAENNDISPDLRQTGLSDEDLSGADLGDEANLNMADLWGVNLGEADLHTEQKR